MGSEKGVQRVIQFNATVLSNKGLAPDEFVTNAVLLEDTYERVSILLIGASLLPKDGSAQLHTLIDAAQLALAVQEPRSAASILTHIMTVLEIPERPETLSEQVLAARRALYIREVQKAIATRELPPDMATDAERAG